MCIYIYIYVYIRGLLRDLVAHVCAVDQVGAVLLVLHVGHIQICLHFSMCACHPCAGAMQSSLYRSNFNG